MFEPEGLALLDPTTIRYNPAPPGTADPDSTEPVFLREFLITNNYSLDAQLNAFGFQLFRSNRDQSVFSLRTSYHYGSE